MDVLYPVRESRENEELRFSLRSLENLPHDKVFIVGYKPKWVKNVHHIPTEQGPKETEKYQNVLNNLLTAVEAPELSEEFILMNDDFFILKPLTELPTYHRGQMREVIDYYGKYGTGFFYEHMQDVKALLHELGYKKPKSYELHIPMKFEKKKLKKVLELSRDRGVYNKRTLYGNIYKIGGEQIKDVKTTKVRKKDWAEDQMFLSSNDQNLSRGELGKFLRKKFPNPSKYEA